EGIDASVDVYQIIVVEAAKHVDQRVGIADVGQEAVAHPLPFARSLGQSGNIKDLYNRRNQLLGDLEFLQFSKARVRNPDHSEI
ncbi:MAG TPA: hypothetical protein PLD74_06285, partial [Prolixibacteraceae bacterium]|nr:hypothetical protein [Prolixibacteraceae bacterium]